MELLIVIAIIVANRLERGYNNQPPVVSHPHGQGPGYSFGQGYMSHVQVEA